MLVNSLLYGSARISHSGVYALVATWFGVSSDTDSFFLIYSVAIFLVSSFSTVLGMVMIPKIKVLTFWDLGLPLLIGFLGIETLAVLLQSKLLGSLALFVSTSLASSLLAGRLANEGRTTIPPVASIFGLLVTLGYAFLNRDLVSLGFALGFGEVTRYLILLHFGRRLVSRGPFTLYQYLPYLIIFALFSAVVPLTRVIPSFLGSEGDVTLFSYALGLVMLIVAFPSLGALVTNGSQWTGRVDLKKLEDQMSWSILAPITWLGVIASWWSLPFYQDFFPSSIGWSLLFMIVIILSLGLPAFILVYSLVPAVVMRETKSWLLGASLGYLGLFSGLGVLGFLTFGIYGLAGAYVVSEYLLGGIFLHASIGNRNGEDRITNSSRSLTEKS